MVLECQSLPAKKKENKVIGYSLMPNMCARLGKGVIWDLII